MRRICIYCQTWESGGIEAFINNILQHMDLSELEIDVVVDSLKGSVFTKRLETLGITFHELSGSQRRLIQNYRLFARLLDERKYDVIHLNVFQALPLAYLSLAKNRGIPIRIAHSHNTMLRRSKTRLLKMGMHRIAKSIFARKATDFWACSAAAAKFMFPKSLLLNPEYQVILNGIDMQRFHFNAEGRELARKRLKIEGAFVVGNVGRLCFQKNQSFLLDIFARVHEDIPSARLLLIGEGEDLAELKEKAMRLQINDNVIFYGTTGCVEELLWAMDVFVFPSVFEGFGIVAIEAQAAGLPTICSDRVPQEVFASSLSQRVPLNASTEQWAKEICARQVDRREDACADLCKKGFDIYSVTKTVYETYCR